MVGLRTATLALGTAMLSPLSAEACVRARSECRAAKLAAAGIGAHRLLACYAKAARRGTHPDPTCLGAARGNLHQAFSRAESKGGCINTGDAASADSLIVGMVEQTVHALRPTTTASHCATSKLRAAATTALALLRAYAAEATEPDASRLAAGIATARSRFAQTFAAAERRGGCSTTDDASAVETIAMSALGQISALEEEKATRTPAQRKLDSQLVYAIEKSRTGAVGGAPDLQPDVNVTDGRVLVDIDATVSENLLAEVTRLGGAVISSLAAYDAIRAMVPLFALETLANRPDVRFITPAAEATTN